MAAVARSFARVKLNKVILHRNSANMWWEIYNFVNNWYKKQCYIWVKLEQNIFVWENDAIFHLWHVSGREDKQVYHDRALVPILGHTQYSDSAIIASNWFLKRLGSVQVSVLIYVSLQCMFNYSTAQGVIVNICSFKRVCTHVGVKSVLFTMQIIANQRVTLSPFVPACTWSCSLCPLVPGLAVCVHLHLLMSLSSVCTFCTHYNPLHLNGLVMPTCTLFNLCP